MQPQAFDAVVIGGGAVGLACAVRLSQGGQGQILVLEKHERLGTEITSRNSQVIHAGIYYEPGSLKERLCVQGRPLLYEFCERYNVPYRQCGKLVVGTRDADQKKLETLLSNAERCQVAAELLSGQAIAALEPRISAEVGLHVPATGIICSETYVQALSALARDQGVVVACESQLRSWTKAPGGYCLEIRERAGSTIQVGAPLVVNSAGLAAFEIAGATLGPAPDFGIKYVRGHYFAMGPKYRNITSRVIYPLPDTKGGGLGIHLTLDLEGNATLGPDTDWRHENDANVTFFDEDIPGLAEKFARAGRGYLPGVSAGELLPSFVGVRPKRVDQQGVLLDFYIQDEGVRGFPGWINLLGIESPGLTASLAIAEEVQRLSDSA